MWLPLPLALAALVSTWPFVPHLVPPPPESPPGECRPWGPDERRRLDMEAVPLATLARFVGCALERNILFQPGSLAAKTATVLGPRPVGRRELAALWSAALADAGLIAERHGAYEVVRAPQ